jgi:hypothetical protein
MHGIAAFVASGRIQPEQADPLITDVAALFARDAAKRRRRDPAQMNATESSVRRPRMREVDVRV